MLNQRYINNKVEYITEDGELIATVELTQNGKQWLVIASEDYMHGTSTMWWQSRKAAEYHVMALRENKTK